MYTRRIFPPSFSISLSLFPKLAWQRNLFSTSFGRNEKMKIEWDLSMCRQSFLRCLCSSRKRFSPNSVRLREFSLSGLEFSHENLMMRCLKALRPTLLLKRRHRCVLCAVHKIDEIIHFMSLRSYKCCVTTLAGRYKYATLRKERERSRFEASL